MIYQRSRRLACAEIILKDCGRIQSQDAQRKTRKAAKLDLPPVESLYEPEDVEQLRNQARIVQFHKPVEVAEGMTARWIEAGHMLGSGCIELTVEEDGRKKVVVFSGDLGPTTLPLIRQFETLQHADVVFLESTYGDRQHRPYAQTVAELERIVKQVAEGSGKILVPTFAIGRSQQLLYHLAIMFLRKEIRPFPVYLDSPMALEATKIYRKYPDLFDEELIAWQKKGLLPLNRTIFKPSVTASDSKAINEVPGPCVVLAGAGMCNAGRILHHLKQNLDNPTTHVLIVGFQAHGSLGRRLVERQKVVTIFGERIPVRASVHTLNGFSGHADQRELLAWFSAIAPAKPRVYLTHGEDHPRGALAKLIQQRHKITPGLPKQGEVIEV